MRRLFWLLVLFFGYIWMITTENEQMVIEKGKVLYRMVVEWLADADIDFQIKRKEFSKNKNRSRRWD